MEVIAFVGSSGTGKSHRALVLAHENKIECIIDDGILIHDNKIVAGFSAKKESSRLKAVRRAIFQDEVQVKSVREQLDKINPNPFNLGVVVDRYDFHVGKDVTKPLITEAELEQFINSKPELNTEEKKKLVKP